jgi:hypothetical protein
MSTQGFEDELRSERSYMAGLYTRLDAERARVKGRYSAALRGPIDVPDGGTLVARDAEVRALARQVKRLNVAGTGLTCVLRRHRRAPGQCRSRGPARRTTHRTRGAG